MIPFIVVIHVIVCFVLILVILLQAGRGSGLSWGSFGGSPQSFLGTKSASFLAKATSVCAIVFLCTCIILNVLETRKSRSLYAGKSSNVSQVDLDKIKQALDQAKANPSTAVDQTTANTAANTATTAAQAVNDAVNNQPSATTTPQPKP